MDLSRIERIILENQAHGKFAKEIIEWEKSNESLDMSIELIKSSKYSVVVFNAAVCLRNKLKELIQELDDNSVENIFEFIIEKVSEENKTYDERCVPILLNALAIITSGRLDYMDQVSFLPLDYQIPFFQFCFELLVPPYFNYEALNHKLSDMVPYFMQLLQGAPVTTEWFRFHTSVMHQTIFDACTDIFPIVVQASQEREFYSSIATMFEYAISAVPYINLCPEEVVYITNLFQLVLDIADNNVSGEATADQYAFSSFIYHQGLDYMPEYFAQPENTEFTTNFFSRFMAFLQKLLEIGLESELFSLLDIASEFICCSIGYFCDPYSGQGEIAEPFEVLIENVLMFMIDIVNTGDFKYITQDLEILFYTLTKEPNKIFARLLSQAIHDPTPGVFYAISTVSEPFRIMLSTSAASKLLEMEETPFTIVYFCRTCALYASESAPQLLEKMLMFTEILPLQVATTVAAIAPLFWKNFVNEPDKLIQPLLTMIPNATSDVACQILKSLYNIFPRVTPENNIRIIMDDLSQLMGDAVQAELQNDNYQQNIDFICTIIEGVPKFEIDSYYKEYFYSIFNQLFPLLRDYFVNTDPAIQNPLAKFIGNSLGHNWCNPSTYGEFIVQWLSNVIPEYLTREHFRVLLYLAPFIFGDDNSFLDECLRQTFESNDKDNIKDSLDFCYKLVKKIPQMLSSVLTYILPMINQDVPRILCVKAVEVLGNIVVIPNIDLSEFSVDIVNTIISSLFIDIDEKQDIIYRVAILFRLGKFVSKKEIAEHIAAIAGNTQESMEFIEAFEKFDDPKQLEVPAFKMFDAYRSLLPTN
ncbi:hypothetical protein TVAG_282050 [Trichomonas vaginalis G3]|uniref:Importin N-terminal domain-containing protein n=1 Tax=Trichomonas vaginalis (strain ATCC PRA-98 / G3) TaxID=412133 RepID=A2E9S0_TRIV3|nr:armadillo (ARM) repeat-containing protein family [Trichomonas vaginalis G3]EAY10605.1 hypothetical protein TVAG_282050 [Trichomonas vaginalis G3]KAI5540857.1 armadillo (ARM) repeat-containing protein family [Trichomonas vaginalis G3]|eukprot:XP_001322828.1 hypothetical protein [Trichomonas vaginalis G3]